MNTDQLNEGRKTLRDYPFSKDYKLLGQLLETQAVICVCDVQLGEQATTRRVAKTYGFTRENGIAKGESIYIVKGNSGTIFWHEDIAGFLLKCQSFNLEFLAPQRDEELTADPCPKQSALAQFFMWIGICITALVATTILLLMLYSMSRP